MCSTCLEPSETSHAPFGSHAKFQQILSDPFLNAAKYKWPDLGAFKKVLFTSFSGVNKQDNDQAEARVRGMGADVQRHFQSMNVEISVKETQGATLSRSLNHTLLSSLGICLAQDLCCPRVGGIFSTQPLQGGGVGGGTHINEAVLHVHTPDQGAPTVPSQEGGHIHSEECRWRGGEKPRAQGATGFLILGRYLWDY